MAIPDMVRRITERTPGNVTPAEPDPPSATDLLNPPGTICECGDKGCCDPIAYPKGLP